MTNHLRRKRSCKCLKNDIDLSACEKFILNGMSFSEYDRSFEKNTMQLIKSNCEPKTSIFKHGPSINEHFREVLGEEIENNEVISIQKHICKYCKKYFNHQQSLNRHIKNCSEKKNDDLVKNSMTELVNILNNQIQEQRNQIKELNKKNRENKKELEKRDKHISELIKKAGINNNTINIQNNIKLLSFNQTDTSHLTDMDIIKCIKHSNYCVYHLINKVHFDENKPENHNIYISNLKNNYVMAYDGVKWTYLDYDTEIDKIIDKNENIIEMKLEEWIDKGNKYPELVKKFNNYLNKKENDLIINKIKKDIKLLLYNNRNMIIDN